MKNKAAFTLIEILVVVGVLTVLVVSVGGIMGMTFKAKNSSEGNELLSAKAVYVLNELKRNILNADVYKITCPSGGIGTSISFIDKDNIKTILSCLSSPISQIASVSAENGTFNLLDSGITADSDCSKFVECDPLIVLPGKKVNLVKFKLILKGPDNAAGAGISGTYYGVAVPRE